jgi:hypothetical protein
MAKDGADGRWRIQRREDAVETTLKQTPKHGKHKELPRFRALVRR